MNNLDNLIAKNIIQFQLLLNKLIPFMSHWSKSCRKSSSMFVKYLKFHLDLLRIWQHKFRKRTAIIWYFSSQIFQGFLFQNSGFQSFFPHLPLSQTFHICLPLALSNKSVTFLRQLLCQLQRAEVFQFAPNYPFRYTKI